jgi:FkbM family methyltransferase
MKLDLTRLRLVRRAILTKRNLEDIVLRIDRQTRELPATTVEASARLDTIAYDSTALLEAARELVQAATESVRREDLDRAIRGLESRIVQALDERDRLSVDQLDVMRERLEALLRGAPEQGGARLDTAARRPAIAEDGVEPALLSHIAPFLVDRHAFDVGAHRGRYAEELLAKGLEVVAVEPHPELASSLAEQLGRFPRAIVKAVAADASAGRTRLYMAEPSNGDVVDDLTLFSTLLDRGGAGTLSFRSGPEIETTTVDLLRQELGWPEEVGLVKVDVEGAEARVLQGLGATRPEVLMLEYWGQDHMLALPDQHGAIAALPYELVAAGMRRSIAIVHDAGRVRFAVNPDQVPPASWGNVLFFSRPEAFFSAVRWCEAHLEERFGTER